MKRIKDNYVLQLLYSIIKFIVFAILIIYLIFVLTQRFIKKSIFGYSVYTVSSESMKPIFKMGDIILVKDAKFDDIQYKDIITYNATEGELSGFTVTHRVINIDENERTLVTRGDVNEANDPKINESQIIGKVVYKFKIFSFILKALNNKYVFFLLFVIPLGIVLSLDIYDFVYELKHPIEDEE